MLNTNIQKNNEQRRRSKRRLCLSYNPLPRPYQRAFANPCHFLYHSITLARRQQVEGMGQVDIWISMDQSSMKSEVCG